MGELAASSVRRDDRNAGVRPPRGLARSAWELWVRIGLPAAGALISPGWKDVGSFLDRAFGFHRTYDLPALWRSAEIQDVHSRRVSLGAGSSSGAKGLSRPAFYALEPGSWRDYVTLLHLPYTAWHLSYVAIGAAGAGLHNDRLVAALAAFSWR